MSFTETRYGKAICELGQKALHKYTKEKQQYALRVRTAEIEDTINQEATNGNNYIAYVPVGNCTEYIVLVFEKTKS